LLFKKTSKGMCALKIGGWRKKRKKLGDEKKNQKRDQL
jgi:hypothetical protein